VARARGPDYQKNLLKRQRQRNRDVIYNVALQDRCHACGVPLGEHRIPAGDKVICDSCDDIMTKHGYIQISDWQRLYRDGSIKHVRFEIKDVVTGRIEK